jgi:hypothetical protein
MSRDFTRQGRVDRCRSTAAGSVGRAGKYDAVLRDDTGVRVGDRNEMTINLGERRTRD